MSLTQPYPELDELLESVGDAGNRLSEIDACEGAAGNLSVFFTWAIDPQPIFPVVEEIELPVSVPHLAGGALIMSGSGRRLREIYKDPAANMGFLKIHADGQTGSLYTSPKKKFVRLSSEYNSHLGIHEDQVSQTGSNFHAVAHAQPRHITYLSHIAKFRDESYLNKHLLRWEPELIINLPEGIGVVPFQIPGSPEMQAGTVSSLRQHRVVLWCKHGIVARSDHSIKAAIDRIEYAEAAATYEYLDLSNQSMADRLSDEEIRAICAFWNIQQKIF